MMIVTETMLHRASGYMKNPPLKNRSMTEIFGATGCVAAVAPLSGAS